MATAPKLLPWNRTTRHKTGSCQQLHWPVLPVIILYLCDAGKLLTYFAASMADIETSEAAQQNKQSVKYWEPYVQPYGILLVVDVESGNILAASENISEYFVQKVPDCLGRHLSVLLGQQIADDFIRHLQHRNLEESNPVPVERKGKNGKVIRFDAILHRLENHGIIEFEYVTGKPRQNPQTFKLLKLAFRNMQENKSLKELCQNTTELLARLTGFDRVMVYIFDQDKNWQVFAETNNGQLPGFLGLFFPHYDLPPEKEKIYSKKIIRYIPDTSFEKVKVRYNHELNLAENKWRYISMSCSPAFILNYWQNMGVAASITLPVHLNSQLWGLVVLHNARPCCLNYELRSSCELLVQMLSSQIVLLEQAEYNNRSMEKAHKLNQLVELVSSHQDFINAFYESPALFLKLVSAQGIVVTLNGTMHHFGETPPEYVVQQLVEWLADEVEDNVFATDHISAHIPNMAAYKRICSGLLAATISHKRKNYILWFRPEVNKVIRWAGTPLQTADQKSGQLPVRSTFSPWTESLYGYSRPWHKLDLQFAAELRKMITEAVLRQLQETAERDAKFRLLFQNSSDIQIILEEDLSVRYVSNSIEKILGYKSENFNTDWKDLIHPDDLELVSGYFEMVKDNPGFKQEVEYRVQNARKQYLWLETIATNLLDNHSIKGIVCNTRDVTSKVNTRNKLKKFQRAIEASPSGIAILDATRENYPVVYINPGYEQLTGYNSMETLEKEFVFFEESFAENLQELRRLKITIKQNTDSEVLLRCVRKDGMHFWSQMHVAPIYDEKGAVSNFVVIMTDTTFRKTSEEKLRDYAEKLHRSNEELQTFAYVASHDLQEPLRTIAGFSELLEEGYSTQLDAEAKEYFEFIMSATRRMKSLIQDLLQFSRVSTAREFIQEVNITRVVEKTLSNLKTLIDENEAVITYEQLPLLLINETMMLQVFQNLISNAIKYRTEEKPRVHISVSKKETEWEFCVKDNGIGIDPRFHERIFVIFQRLHSREEYSGTGIGLAICKKIIEKYGGRIWVESIEGEGCSFMFTLPDIVQID